MKLPKPFSVQSTHLPALLIVIAGLVSGCSDSNTIPADSDSVQFIVDGNNGTSNEGTGITNMESASDRPVGDTNGESNPSTTIESQPSMPVVPNPSSPTSIRVDFDITVPAYMSDGLQVKLNLGDSDTTAAWVRDESWTASVNTPANTEKLLVVTFNDDNGAITLGSFETTFKTGASETESYQITADQFNINRWDSDGDGVSNLSELMAGTNPRGENAPEPVQASLVLVPDKTFRFNWQSSENAQFYRLLENADGFSGFTQVAENIDGAVQSFDLRVALYNRFNASYIVQACNSTACTDSEAISVSGTLESAVGYFKASDSKSYDDFGSSVVISADGNTFALVNGSRDIYIFERSSGSWQEQEILQIPVSLREHPNLSISADGNTLAVQGTTAINVYERTGRVWELDLIPVPFDFDATDSGSQPFSGSIDISADGNTLAFRPTIGQKRSDLSPEIVYVIARTGEGWQQQASLLPNRVEDPVGVDGFGRSVSLSEDGDILVISASGDDVTMPNSGAVYVFSRTNSNWQQENFIKASNADAGDVFASAVKISADGSTIAVGAIGEDSAAIGVSGEQIDNGASQSGAVYIFTLIAGVWDQQAYLKASNTNSGDGFGGSLSISADGNTLAVAAQAEASFSRGINGDQVNDISPSAGAVYLFTRNNRNWQQSAYIKSSNTSPGSEECIFEVFNDGELLQFGVSGDVFGYSISLSADGQTLAVGAPRECSSATGINGDQSDNSAVNSGAVYLY